MSLRRVLVTRPGQSAPGTAARLAEAGFAPLVLPLSETVSVAPVVMPDPAATEAVVVTSANAIRHASGELLGLLRGRRCYAVGPRTGEAAGGAGLCVVRKDAGEAMALAAQIAAEFPPGSRILYLCGKVRGTNFETAMEAAGVVVEALETYDTRGVRYTIDAVGDTIGWNPIWGAVVYSAGGAGHLAALAERPQLADLFAQTRFFCISRQAAEALGENRRIIIAHEPDEDGLLRAMTGPGVF